MAYEEVFILTDHQGNASQTTMRYHLTSVRMTVIKMIRDNKCWEDVDKRELLCTVGWNVNWCSHYGKQY